ncbi:BTB/POZ domain-containing protein 3 [Pleurostoma richardsiae]|uniref:BTB/POZ domain-containing protein 3 n=1 Tax=Pleurostoma richardsiae TaxID=41990 RepID=A0AA38VP36_9PEZI|nr:BTB/POZ domain-containing protein 3 [Pleurostoma richardsiae]
MVLRKDELEAKLKDEHDLIQSGVLRDDNPLDTTSDFNKFLEACRRGDLKTCQELISQGININGKDHFDYTPLIIASLCGHFELVQLLLESGALAERNTFQGERAVYNALNDRIRNLLLSYDYSKSTDPLQPWASHITSLLTRQVPRTSDIALTAGPETFHLHKFLLSSRTPYFRRKLAEAPETTTWKLSHTVPIEAFRIVSLYVYLGELPRDLVDPRSGSSEEEVFKGIDKISKQLEVERLWEAVLSGNDRRLARQRYQAEVERAQVQIEAFYRENVLKHKMVVDTRKVNDVKWRHDNSIFADCLLCADEFAEDDEELVDDAGDMRITGIPVGPGVAAASADRPRKTRKSVLYPVHKAMLIRSPYFETMFSSEFMEAQTSEHLHVIKVDCPPEVLEIILTFIYTERADCPLEHALDLLYAADMLFLDKLKTKAAIAISTLGSGNNNVLVDRTHGGMQDGDSQHEVEMEPINIYDVIHAAWDLRVQRLEEFAARYLAYRLEDYIDEPEFAELIQESASRLKTREETDTIELLDDIRYYLGERFRLRFEDAGLDEMLDENGEINPALVEGLAKEGDSEPVGSLDDTTRTAKLDISEGREYGEALTPEAEGGGVRTLEGELVEDEFASDALNYQILLRKIDIMLDRLKLDA